MTSDLTCRRADFTLPQGEHYLNCAYMSPLPRAVEQAGLAGLRSKRWPARITADDFFRDVNQLRASFGGLIGAEESGRVSVMPSVSYGLATVAANVPLKPGGKVVVADQQFPSNIYAWRRLTRERGGSVEQVPLPEQDSGSATEAMVQAIDRDTAIVAVGAVHWSDGRRFDLEKIADRTRSVGALLVVDGTQTVGAVPFDLAAVKPDALICAGYKWLLGPYGIAVAWYGPALDDGRPLEETWLSRPDSEDFARLADYRDNYRPGAARYDMGEASNFILVPMLLAATRLIAEWGVDRISRYVTKLTSRIALEASELGYLVAPERERVPHILGLRIPGAGDIGSLRLRLERSKVHVSVRGNAIRVSPHVYNDQGDVDALLDALKSARANTGATAG